MPSHLGKRRLLVFLVPECLSPWARFSQCLVSIVLGSTLCLISLISYHRLKTHPWACSKSCVIPGHCLGAECWVLKGFYCETSNGLSLPLSKHMQTYTNSVAVSSSLFPYIRGFLMHGFLSTSRICLLGPGLIVLIPDLGTWPLPFWPVTSYSSSQLAWFLILALTFTASQVSSDLTQCPTLDPRVFLTWLLSRMNICA